ncbi:hypothetical protein WJX74_009922 [Apatococcus lobatus]|uniref:Uncharacterized protein n=2 Tax=Apatococcus TaxID=904362 RepID=A0AAW1T3Q4_9CHLO
MTAADWSTTFRLAAGTVCKFGRERLQGHVAKGFLHFLTVSGRCSELQTDAQAAAVRVLQGASGGRQPTPEEDRRRCRWCKLLQEL